MCMVGFNFVINTLVPSGAYAALQGAGFGSHTTVYASANYGHSCTNLLSVFLRLLSFLCVIHIIHITIDMKNLW